MATSILTELLEAVGSKSPNEVRNVCLIAHVDHGKTSLADSLVSANAIVSNRMAGKIRFMDSREDEQIRGITMKSSGVSLLYGPLVVHIIDSPGHVDFSSEVTSALLLTDIALLLVDVVEGVCSQTQILLREAIYHGQTVILVINKIDRLYVDLKMNATEAYTHIQRLLEAVNSCVSQVVAGIVLEDESIGPIEEIENRLHFEPAKGNVVFASAIYGFAFGVEDFANIYSEKLKLEKKNLLESLYGDFYFQGGAIQTGASNKGKRTLFDQLILDPIWQLIDFGLVKKDVAKLSALSERLNVTFKSKRAEDGFAELMRSWMPLARACLRACARAPSARNAFSPERRLNLLLNAQLQHPLREAIRDCSVEGMTVVFVVKFFRSDEAKLAMCRVLSGKLHPGQELYVITKGDDEPILTKIDRLCLLRGRECIALSSANAGSICAIEAHNLVQNATLCSEPVVMGIELSREFGDPLVRVTISPKDLEKEDDLRRALKLLAVLDPSLRVMELETGELAMVTAGEVHLQKCLKDLEDLGFDELEVSTPIVPFLEAVIPDITLTQQQIIEQETECRVRDSLYLKLRCAPLSSDVVEFLERNREILQSLRESRDVDGAVASFRTKLREICCSSLPVMKGTWWYKKSNEEISKLVDQIWAFGPDRACANILINQISDYDRKLIWNQDGHIRNMDQCIVAGFEIFVTNGPLCHETMQGVAIIVEDWTMNEEDSAVVGQLISAVKATCKAASKKISLRLVAAMYKCRVTTSTQALGKVHAVLAQRKAKVINEDINEATGLFEVDARLPVVESFSFCDHLRTNTSGLASAQLQFSHWEIIDEDPYWQPSTQEEMEEFGLKGDSPNHARGYMDAVRRRKGLPTEELIVISAEKQRNLKKNK